MIDTLTQTKEALHEILRLTGWTQREVARRCEIAPAIICRILSGRIIRTPSAKDREKVSALLAYVHHTILCDVCNGTGIIASVGPCPACRVQPTETPKCMTTI